MCSARYILFLWHNHTILPVTIQHNHTQRTISTYHIQSSLITITYKQIKAVIALLGSILDFQLMLKILQVPACKMAIFSVRNRPASHPTTSISCPKEIPHIFQILLGLLPHSAPSWIFS